MKAYLFYTLISFLVVIILYCGIGLLDTAITDKYMIEQGRMFVEMDADNQPIEQTNSELKKIDELENQIRLTQTILTSLACATFIIIILLILKRKKIIKTKAQQII